MKRIKKSDPDDCDCHFSIQQVPTTAPGEGAAAAEGGDQEGGEDDAQPAAMEEG